MIRGVSALMDVMFMHICIHFIFMVPEALPVCDGCLVIAFCDLDTFKEPCLVVLLKTSEE